MLTIREINLWVVAVPVERGTRRSALGGIPTRTSRTRERVRSARRGNEVLDNHA